MAAARAGIRRNELTRWISQRLAEAGMVSHPTGFPEDVSYFSSGRTWRARCSDSSFGRQRVTGQLMCR